MTESKPAPFDLDKVLAEIAEDQKVDRGAKRLLTQDDIRRLVEDSRRRREANLVKKPEGSAS